MEMKDTTNIEKINNGNLFDQNSLIRRGDIVYADLAPSVRDEVGGMRPVIIIQNDSANKYSQTVIVVPITARLDKAKLPTHVLILGKQHGLSVNSVALVERIKTIDKKKIITKIGHITKKDIKSIEQAILVLFGISTPKNYDKEAEQYYRFILNETVMFLEDYKTEFKEVREDLKKIINKTLLKYCVGFLNGNGGALYYGITDKREVKGVKITVDNMDEIYKTINNNLYNITPHISLDYFKIQFNKVYDKNNQVIKDLYVVEIVVRKTDNKTIYFANDKELFIRGKGITKKLGCVEMVSYIRKKIMDEKGAN